MSYNSPYENYVELKVLSASPLELVTMLYRAAIDSIEEARRGLATGESKRRAGSVARACDVIVELTQSLNHEQGGELSRNLLELYDYILRRIHESNREGDDAGFREAIQLLSTLLEGWQSIESSMDATAAKVLEREHQPLQCSF
ncbi:MAG: flagellar export chaperone FliS [Bryobacterales bacterium]|nr:flagellar export chaperone FliS [Bryobacterales bacterium]